jgi:hypothetical protein
MKAGAIENIAMAASHWFVNGLLTNRQAKGQQFCGR